MCIHCRAASTVTEITCRSDTNLDVSLCRGLVAVVLSTLYCSWSDMPDSSCNCKSCLVCVVVIPELEMIVPCLELILVIAGHAGRCRDRLAESEVSHSLFLVLTWL